MSLLYSFAVFPMKNDVTSSRIDPVGRQQQILTWEVPAVVGTSQKP